MKINLVEIDGILVRKDIFEIKFTCDLQKCKGACCTLESEFGAPLMEEELPEIERALPAAEKYLSEEKVNEIKKNGFYEVKEDVFLTRSIDKKDCVFVYYEGTVAKCSLERAFFNGESDFRKPISCHLFPIRISDFGGEILRYEEFSECKPALEKGTETNLSVADFCKDGLERAYGKDWYQKLIETKR